MKLSHVGNFLGFGWCDSGHNKKWAKAIVARELPMEAKVIHISLVLVRRERVTSAAQNGVRLSLGKIEVFPWRLLLMFRSVEFDLGTTGITVPLSALTVLETRAPPCFMVRIDQV